jgi:N-acetyl-anhydromuramyl-L-alanine amidase AmpD
MCAGAEIVNIISKPADPANHGAYRIFAIELIVIHIEAGTEEGTINWFANPKSHVSAHYSVSKTGQVYQHVPEDLVAYHAGIPKPCVWADESKNPYPGRNPNVYSVGIEHEGFDDGQSWPEAQVQASAALVADICTRHQIPIDRAHVVGHHEIFAGHSCPGSACPIDRIVELAAAIKDIP